MRNQIKHWCQQQFHVLCWKLVSYRNCPFRIVKESKHLSFLEQQFWIWAGLNWPFIPLKVEILNWVQFKLHVHVGFSDENFKNNCKNFLHTLHFHWIMPGHFCNVQGFALVVFDKFLSFLVVCISLVYLDPTWLQLFLHMWTNFISYICVICVCLTNFGRILQGWKAYYNLPTLQNHFYTHVSIWLEFFSWFYYIV